MKSVDFNNAYYVKLGKGGIWEGSSIRENKIRIGWVGWPIVEINQRKWDDLKRKYRKKYKSEGSATKDINALKKIVESTSDDIWTTFHKGYLWWCRVGEPKISEDKTSNYRKVKGKWNNCDIANQPLIINQIPGSISKKQRFQGTICSFEEKEVEDLIRLLNNQPSNFYKSISKEKTTFIEEVEKGL